MVTQKTPRTARTRLAVGAPRAGPPLWLMNK
jgi:hypothetical protein